MFFVVGMIAAWRNHGALECESVPAGSADAFREVGADADLRAISYRKGHRIAEDQRARWNCDGTASVKT
jgi:hypothetical protein